MIRPTNEDLSIKSRTGYANLILVLTLLLIFLTASRSPLDSDLWWHLRSGQVMMETGKPLVTDIFSYTRDGQAWTNHSWLGEVLIFQIYRISGWTGLSAWMGLVAVLVGVVIWKLIPGGVFTKAAFVLLASVSCSPLWTPRPQFFSLLLLAFLILALDTWIDHGGRAIWFVSILFIIWSNLHGGYLLGILYLVMCAIGLLADALLFSEPERGGLLRKAGIILVTAVSGYLFTAVNPNGLRMWTIPFETVGVGILRQFIQEWASPDFHAVEVWPFAIWILLLIFSLARNSKKIINRRLFPALFFILLAFYARRNIAAAVLTSVWILVSAWVDAWSTFNLGESLPDWLRRAITFYRSHRGKELPASQKRVINLLLAGVLGIFAFLKLVAVTHPVLMDAFEARYYPKDALSFMQINPPVTDGRLFNAYNWGGYIEWKDPDTLVFVDGRTDLFGDEVLGQWISVMQADNDWQEILKKWNVTRIMIEPDRPLVKAAEMAGWVEVYRDRQAVVFDRVSG